MKRTFAMLLISLLATACMPGGDSDPELQRWMRVLDLKKSAALEPTVESRQQYVDALVDFLNDHPDHARARALYEEALVARGTELCESGLHDAAVEVARHALQLFPSSEGAAALLAEAGRLRHVREPDFAALEPGVAAEEVRRRIGAPIPGWTRRTERNGTVHEAWFYRREDGGVAGVFFRDRRLHATEFYSDGIAAETRK